MKFYIFIFLFFSAPFLFAQKFDGLSEPFQQAVVSATVSGRVENVVANEGDFVKKGYPIIYMDKESEEIETELRKIISESQSEIEGAHKKVDTYFKDFKATQKLFEESQSISEEQLWEKELNFKVAKAEYEQLVSKEKQEELEYKLAKVALSKKIIRAPFDCFVVKHHRQRYESVQALEPLVEVVDVNKIKFVSYVDAVSAQDIKKNQEVEIHFRGAKKTRVKKGKVFFISPVVDRSSMLRVIKVLIENKDHSIEPGVSAQMVLINKAAKNGH